MGKTRMLKVNELLRHHVSQILLEEANDPRIGFITVVGIDVSRDLQHAKVHVSVMGTDKKKRDTMIGLNQAKGFVQRELGKRIKMKFLPQIEFVRDESIEYSLHIAKIFREIHDEDKVENNVEKEGSQKSE